MLNSYGPAIASVAGFYVLSYVPQVLKNYLIVKASGGFNNNEPRSQVKRLEGENVDKSTLQLINRCESAHYNSLESFAPFASAVALAMLRNAPVATVNKAALLFLGFRTAYLGAYLSASIQMLATYAPAIASVAGFYVLSYVPHFLKGYLVVKASGGYNNNNPRGEVKRLEEKNVDKSTLRLIKRCEAAHNNSLENFAPFASAVALAMLRSKDKLFFPRTQLLTFSLRRTCVATVNKAALLFLGLRTAYLGAYLSDQATLRSTLWSGTFGTVLYLFFKAYKGRL